MENNLTFQQKATRTLEPGSPEELAAFQGLQARLPQINLRKGGTTHPFLMPQFLTGAPAFLAGEYWFRASCSS